MNLHFQAAAIIVGESSYRIPNWKNNTVCKGMTTGDMKRRRLQGKQKPCPTAAQVYAASKAVSELAPEAERNGQRCMNVVLRLGAGMACSMCDKLPLNNVDVQSKTVWLSYEIANELIYKCHDTMNAMAAMNPLINALDRLVPAKSRRLQGVKDKDFIGFDIASCTSKSSKLAVGDNAAIKIVECRNLALWF